MGPTPATRRTTATRPVRGQPDRRTDTFYVKQGGGLSRTARSPPGWARRACPIRALAAASSTTKRRLARPGGRERRRAPARRAARGGRAAAARPAEAALSQPGGGRSRTARRRPGRPSHAANSRGLAVGDVDDDGDPDLVVVNSDQPARLLLDAVGQDHPWLGLRLVEADGRRDAPGAVATLRRRGAPDLVRHVHTDGSYASASDPRLLFGLGRGAEPAALEVRWPDGARERFERPRPRPLHHPAAGPGRGARGARPEAVKALLLLLALAPQGAAPALREVPYPQLEGMAPAVARQLSGGAEPGSSRRRRPVAPTPGGVGRGRAPLPRLRPGRPRRRPVT